VPATFINSSRVPVHCRQDFSCQLKALCVIARKSAGPSGNQRLHTKAAACRIFVQCTKICGADAKSGSGTARAPGKEQLKKILPNK
jgi:hypothetical protein